MEPPCLCCAAIGRGIGAIIVAVSSSATSQVGLGIQVSISPQATLSLLKSHPCLKNDVQRIPGPPEVIMIRGNVSAFESSSSLAICLTVRIRSAKKQKVVNCMKILLDVAKESADWFPPLKSALGGLNALIAHYEVPTGSATITYMCDAVPCSNSKMSKRRSRTSSRSWIGSRNTSPLRQSKETPRKQIDAKGWQGACQFVSCERFQRPSQRVWSYRTRIPEAASKERRYSIHGEGGRLPAGRSAHRAAPRSHSLLSGG